MNTLKQLIDRIVEFGTNEKLVSKNKTLELQRLLVEIYAEYLKVETTFDDTDYKEPLSADYDKIRKVVTKHFPDFGYYYSTFRSYELNENTDLVTKDSIDDVTDIIKDLIEVQWRLKNNSEKDGLYQFKFLMKHYSEQHLVDLLKYLKDKNG